MEEIPDLPCPQAQEQIAAVVNVFPRGRLFVRLGEQNVDNFRSQCVEEVVEVMQALLQKRKRNADQLLEGR